MNRDHIIKLAREARLIKDWMVLCEQDSDALTKFAALVAAAEREACAKVAEAWGSWVGDGHLVATAIRARGDKPCN